MTAVLAAAALVLVGGLAAELAARWWIARRTRFAVWPPGMRVEVRQDLFPELEPRFRFEVNADGERGGAARAHEDGLFRILTVGGSSVECFALDQATSWPGQLELLLNRGDALDVLGARRVHVGNIGHSGVGAAELEMILERVLPNYERLDAIVVMVGASTAYHWLEDGAPPAGAPAVVPEDALFARRPGRQPFGWKPSATALVELIRRSRQALFRPVEIRENTGAWQIAARKMRAQATEIRSVLPDPSAVVQHFEHHFRRALRHAMARSRRVLVLRQPWFEEPYTAEEQAHFWHGGIGRPWKEKVSVYFKYEVINRVLSLLDEQVVAVAEELGLQHLNLRPLLNKGLHHYYDHDHFTPAGAALVAPAVARALTGQERSQRPGAGVETPVRRLTQPRVPLAAR
jgi:lysophospholipase L1-like esterase